MKETEASGKLKQLLSEHGMTLKDLSEKLDIPLPTLWKWSSGHSTPPTYVLTLIEFYLTHQKKR